MLLLLTKGAKRKVFLNSFSSYVLCNYYCFFFTSMGPKRIISKFYLFSHHLTVVVRPFCICYLKDILLWNHWFNFNQSCPGSSLFIIKVFTFKIQQITVFPTHYCVQQFSVSTLDFNIHLFNIPLSTCCGCFMLHLA